MATCCFQRVANRHTQLTSSDADCRTFAVTAEPVVDQSHTLPSLVCMSSFLLCCCDNYWVFFIDCCMYCRLDSNSRLNLPKTKTQRFKTNMKTLNFHK